MSAKKRRLAKSRHPTPIEAFGICDACQRGECKKCRQLKGGRQCVCEAPEHHRQADPVGDYIGQKEPAPEGKPLDKIKKVPTKRPGAWWMGKWGINLNPHSTNKKPDQK